MFEDKVDWIAPDGTLTKSILVAGTYGPKPTEECVCNIKVASCHLDVRRFNEGPVTIGRMDTIGGRLLEKCLMSMDCGEICNSYFHMHEAEISVVIELKSFKSHGAIYEWNAKKKYDLALMHKKKGVELFKEDYYDASFRFSKAFKLLSSIPIEVEDPPDVVDGVPVADINSLKVNLYNNMASCNLKHDEFEIAIDLCKKVLDRDRDNVKALYKLGVCYNEVHCFDKAYETLRRVVSIDPTNKAAAEKLKVVANNVRRANAKVNAMVKRMFI